MEIDEVSPLPGLQEGEALEAQLVKRPRNEENGIPRSPSVPIKSAMSSGFMRSVLKVFIQRAEPNYAQPWQMKPQRGASGSGFVLNVKKRQILTNSHVVAHATTVHVRRPGNPKKWRARVLCEGKLCDLALLTVDDENFWADNFLEPTFVDVPELQDTILVVGYPIGGDSLSITKGIVSRVTLARYSTSGNRLLSIQIDSAINSGNSGGPAFSDLHHGKVAGVAFMKIVSTDNVGYIIPKMVVQHFLSEFEMYETFRGVCSCGFLWQDMENQHLREHFKVPTSGSGVLVYKIDPLHPARGALQENDVVMEIEGVPIADDGTVEFRREERVEFVHEVMTKHIDDSVHLKVMRDGIVSDVEYRLGRVHSLVPSLAGEDCVPSYFVVGGLVFVPLSLPFLEHGYGPTKIRMAPPQIVSLLLEYKSAPDDQVVIMFQILAAEINFGYRSFQTVQTETFNGVKLHNLKQLVELVDNCRDKYMKFGMEGGKFIIFDREQALTEGPHILKQHAIAFDRSEDLREEAAAKAMET